MVVREAVATALGVGASSIEGVDWDADEAVVFSIPQARRVALLRKIRAAVAAFDNLTDSKRRAVPEPVQLGFARNASCIAMIAEFAQMPNENARAERVRGSRDARQEAREFARRGSTVALQQKNLLPKLAVGRVTGTDS